MSKRFLLRWAVCTAGAACGAVAVLLVIAAAILAVDKLPAVYVYGALVLAIVVFVGAVCARVWEDEENGAPGTAKARPPVKRYGGGR